MNKNEKMEFDEMMALTMESCKKWAPIPDVQYKHEKVNYIKAYIKIMLNNWEYDNVRQVFKTNTVDEAVKLIESFDYTTFEDWK